MTRVGPTLKEQFERALEMDAPEREAWLASLRAMDPQRAARLERLIAQDAGGVDPFGRSIESLKRSLDFKANHWIGREIGGFRLLRLLGEGGMGAVFLAERHLGDLRQLVALKLLRGQWLDERAVARFGDERRILARLHHPNIATLVDAGADRDGRPFLAMEYIEGVPLGEYCDRKRLTVRQRLRLCRGLLSALAYAHRMLVVHRDLKPGNVLVTPDGTPKLLDFGIARLVDSDALARATATRPFTPAYASPEQKAGELVSTASDVYSMGVLLYELVVGVLPPRNGAARTRTETGQILPATRFRQLDPQKRHELARQRGGDARALLRSLRGNLGRVIERALEPDPEHRYATMEALAGDLEAVLAGRPPSGIHTTHVARAMAFGRRHAWPLALAALVLVAAAVVLGQAWLGAKSLEAERDRALAEAEKSRQIAGFVEAMLSAVNPDRAQGMDRKLMVLVLDSAGKRALHDLAGQPDVRTAIERTIARSYNSIGEYAPAVTHFDRALAAAGQAGSPPDPRVSLLTGKARALGNLGKRKQAMAVAHKAMALAAGLPPDARARLYAQSTLAGFQCDGGHFEACRAAYAQVLPLQQRALGTTDPATEESLRGLAYAQSKLGQFDQARRNYRELLAQMREQYGDDDSRTLNTINGLAITWLEQKQFARAEELLKPAVQRAEKSFGPEHPLTLNMLSNLGGAIRQQPGRNAEARPYYEKVLAATRKLFGPDSMRTVIAETNLATLLRDAGELDAAERHARTAVAHMDRAFGATSPYRGMLLDTLGSILTAEHRYAEAARTFDRAWKIFSQGGYSKDNPAVQSVVAHCVELYRAWDRPEQLAHWKARLKTS